MNKLFELVRKNPVWIWIDNIRTSAPTIEANSFTNAYELYIDEHKDWLNIRYSGTIAEFIDGKEFTPQDGDVETWAINYSQDAVKNEYRPFYRGQELNWFKTKVALNMLIKVGTQDDLNNLLVDLDL